MRVMSRGFGQVSDLRIGRGSGNETVLGVSSAKCLLRLCALVQSTNQVGRGSQSRLGRPDSILGRVIALMIILVSSTRREPAEKRAISDSVAFAEFSLRIGERDSSNIRQL
jgi:hypothetical protein